jgi:membrane associated rhomboid family serine protease
LAELEIAEVLSVAIMVAIIAVTVWRGRNFVLICTLGLFAITGVGFVFHPPQVCTLPDLAWRYTFIDKPLEWYRLFTSLFLHDACGAGHIIGNAFTFVLLGWPLEQKIGWKLTMAIFFITGVLGSIVSTFVVLATGDPVWTQAYAIGASGSIFGIIAYFAVRYPHEKVWAPILVIFMRVPVSVAAVAALAIQAVILMQITNPFIGQLPWPSVLAHVTSFGIGMLATKVPGLQAADTPGQRAFYLDLSPLRDLAVKPADKMEVEGIIAEDIPEVAQVKLEAFVKRASCPQCGQALELDGRKLKSTCGWGVTFEKQAPPKRG